MKINKRHKILYRKTGDGTLRRLDKASKNIYSFVLQEIINRAQEYIELNKNITDVRGLQPIEIIIPENLQEEYLKIVGAPEQVSVYDRNFAILAKLNFKKTLRP